MTIFTTQSFSKANGTTEVLIDGNASYTNATYPQGVNFHQHQFVVAAGDSTVGTLTVTAKAVGGAAEPVYESDGVTALVVDLANPPRTFMLGGGANGLAIESISFLLAGLNGTGNLTITVASWDFS